MPPRIFTIIGDWLKQVVLLLMAQSLPESLKNYFLNVAKTMSTINASHDPFSYLPNANDNFHSFVLMLVVSTEFCSTIMTANPPHSTLNHLTDVNNITLQTGNLATCLKTAIITPLYIKIKIKLQIIAQSHFFPRYRRSLQDW